MTLEHIECKAAFTTDDAGAITGKAWDFSSPDRVGDVIEPRAFAGAVGKSIPMLFAHDQAQAVGVWDSVSIEADGLSVSGKLLVKDVARAAEVRALVLAGGITGLSVGFITKKSTPRKGGGRTIQNLDLVECSLVAIPAHPNARITSQKELNLPEPINAEVEVKAADLQAANDNIAALTKRLETAETKLARPSMAGLESKEAGTAERKALATFARQNDDAELKSLSVGTDPDGGYLVLPTLENGIRTIARDTSPIRALASAVTIGTDSYEVILDVSDVESAWVGEKEDRPETDGPGFIKKSIVVHEMYAAPRATQKILDDAGFDIGGWLEGKIGARFGTVESSAYALGDGVNKPRGFLTYDTDVAADFTRTWGKFQHVISGGATTITADALVRLSLTLRTPYRPNATWLMARETAVQIRHLKDTTGAYIWQPGLLDGSPDRLLGFPVQYDDSMPAVGAGSLSVALADWKQAYQIVDRHGIRVIRDNLTAKPYTIFYSYKRTGGDVVDFNALKFLKTAAS